MHPAVLQTSDGLILRQYSTHEDDLIYFKVQNDNREHIAEFGNLIYETLDEVRNAHLTPEGKIRMGVWKKGSLIGEVCIASKDGEEAEMDIWLIKRETGHGYATSILKTATTFAISKYKRVYAEVDKNNTKSNNLLKRVDYYEPERGRIVEREWGEALVFEASK